MTNYYIFICSDTEAIGGMESSKNIAINRLKQKVWPLFKGTAHRGKLKPGDEGLFYLAGKKEDAQHVIAKATIVGVEKWGVSKGSIDGEDLFSGAPAYVVRLDNVEYFRPVSVRENLANLHLTRECQPGKWGAVLRGGCKILSEDDYNLLST